MKKYNAIIIGLGKIGMLNGFDSKRIQPASHVEAIMKNPDISLTGVCDFDSNLTNTFRKKYPEVENIYESLDELLKNLISKEKHIDIISIATPDNTHTQILELLLKKFHNTTNDLIIFCEKPITPDLKSAKNIQGLIQNTNIHIVVNHIRRWSTIWKEVISLADKIGEIRNCVYYLSTTPENKTSSQIRDGIHIADTISWLNIAKKTSIKRLNVPYHVYEFHLWGTKGKIELLESDKILNLYQIKNSERFEGFKEMYLTYTKTIEESYLKNAYDEFVDFLDKKLPSLSTNIDDAVTATEVFEKYVYDPTVN